MAGNLMKDYVLAAIHKKSIVFSRRDRCHEFVNIAENAPGSAIKSYDAVKPSVKAVSDRM